VHAYGPDIFTEPDGDPDTLANLGPLRPMAGVWESERGGDDHPVVTGTKLDVFSEHYEAHPIDFQTNGPQLFYGLRYHTHILNPAEGPATFHDQVGYWLWEPAANTVLLTLGIPRGQVLLASGPAEADATDFELTAVLGSETNGIASNPFLLEAFRTISYRIQVTTHPDGTWSYEEEGLLQMPDRAEPYPHRDRNTLHRVGPPIPNPLSLMAAQAGAMDEGDGGTVPAVTAEGSLGIGSLRGIGGRPLGLSR